VTLAGFAAAWALHFMAAASPGPAILMAARTGVTEGLRTGIFLSVGLGLGALVWACAALFGLAVLFQAAPALFWGFKIAGGLFLCWLAFQMWRHADEPLVMAERGQVPRSAFSALRLGLTTQLANPKPAVFFGAVFVGTVPPGTAPWVIAALLVAVFLNEMLCNVAVARMFSFAGPRRAYLRLKSTIDRSFGGLLAVLGLKIAVT
jgi:threonine/homoserine/homoserine lactone efflux protein